MTTQLNNKEVNKLSQKTKLTYEEIYAFVASKGCTLLSDSYVNMKQKLCIKCACGENYETTMDSFKNKNRTTCKKCSNKKLSQSVKLNYLKQVRPNANHV